jgi:hypothetical protein
MANVRLISVNATGGAQVTVNASGAVCRFEVIEDESVTPQGLVYQIERDRFVGTYQLAPSTQPIIEQNSLRAGRGSSRQLGLPQQGSVGDYGFQAATPLFKVVSVALATKIRFTEDE